MSVWVKPGPHMHSKHEMRFPPQYHTSYKWGLLFSPITYKCRLRVLCPVRRPMKTLDCVLLKDNNRALVVKLGPEINSRACLCVQQGPRHITKCWFWQVNSSPHIFGSNEPSVTIFDCTQFLRRRKFVKNSTSGTITLPDIIILQIFNVCLCSK